MRVTAGDQQRLFLRAIMPGRFWTVAEAAGLLRVSADTICRAIRAGELPAEERVRYRGNPRGGPFYRRRAYFIPDEALAAYRIARCRGRRGAVGGPGAKRAEPTLEPRQLAELTAAEDMRLSIALTHGTTPEEFERNPGVCLMAELVNKRLDLALGPSPGREAAATAGPRSRPRRAGRSTDGRLRRRAAE